LQVAGLAPPQPDHVLEYAKRTFNWLRTQKRSQTVRELMSLGLHLRIIGASRRIDAFPAFWPHVSRTLTDVLGRHRETLPHTLRERACARFSAPFFQSKPGSCASSFLSGATKIMSSLSAQSS